ncbi:Crp/Fnr family transcriptional regulator [Flavobacterium sp. MC2016-06]|jgi:CRP-like cAMP-binding protein|uniref:Crp/Fnr family transcriptional regulator n=1 Tax=Flavobacterium sp. MC2016-06 TaxID=2676308 RepID=UPI0012BAEDEF|nr:Crp/Fnr family transcriptional regulator [Flavobacterium sp. MC2016-06]MBU3861864.1 Crp/Fnr family transcriptional regulator [Flavobacterium sp. MC2016-06]
MYELFFQNIAKHIQLESSEELLITKKLYLKSVVKNEKLLQSGNYCKEIYFVNKGCLRVFQNHTNGEETTSLFCPENWWASDIMSFSQNIPALSAIDALEDSEIICLNSTDLEELYIKIPKLERFFRILFQNGFGLYQQRLTLALSTSAAIRYTLFTKQYPTLVNRISQKHIAAYLGITPVFLSIIRRKMVSDKN